MAEDAHGDVGVMVPGGDGGGGGEEVDASAHNDMQPIVSLPDALQRTIIDKLPEGRCANFRDRPGREARGIYILT